MKSSLHALQLLVLIAPLACIGPGRAAPVPSLDVSTSCHEAQDFGTTDPQQTFKNCMLDEKQAKDQLAQKWSQFKANDRVRCTPQAPSPSYVEMLTCLEMNQQSLMPYSEGAGVGVPGGTHDSPSPRPAPSPGPRGF